jgi:hypothetical protein
VGQPGDPQEVPDRLTADRFDRSETSVTQLPAACANPNWTFFRLNVMLDTSSQPSMALEDVVQASSL